MLIVFGSINMDMAVKPSHFPQPGETVLCADYDLLPGGKGANQALAAARMGARVALVGCVGNDGYAPQILNNIRRQGVITSGVGQSDQPTGCAFIVQEGDGRNRIIAATAANADASADQVPEEIMKPNYMLLAQMEVPAQEVFVLIERAHHKGMKVILNLAPAVKLPEDILSKVTILILNEIEIVQATGDTQGTTPENLALSLAKGAGITCIVTLGERGSFVAKDDGSSFHVSALNVEVIDTTGAGDAYCGTLGACLYEGMDLENAIRWASVAGSLACTQIGTITAFAYQDDIRAELDKITITR